MMIQVHTTMQACPASQLKLAKVCRNGAMSSLVAKYPYPSPSLVVTSALSSTFLLMLGLPGSRHQNCNLHYATDLVSESSHIKRRHLCHLHRKRLYNSPVCPAACRGRCREGLPEHELRMSAVALLPDKSSLAAEKLKDNLRAKGGLEQLVYAAQHYAAQDQAAATSDEAHTSADSRYICLHVCGCIRLIRRSAAAMT